MSEVINIFFFVLFASWWVRADSLVVEIAVSPYEVSKIVLSTGNNRCLVGPTLC